MKISIFTIFLTVILSSCRPSDSPICQTSCGEVVLRRVNDSCNVLCHIVGGDTVSSWILNYAVYRTDYGDIQGNGENEIMVGVVKTTKYWQSMDKRLFIFKLFGGRHIRPLWLGSRVGSPLEDFEVLRDSFPAMIKTTERTPDSTFQALYRLGGFGLKFVRYEE